MLSSHAVSLPPPKCKGGVQGPTCKAVATCTGHKDVQTEADLLQALAIGPVSNPARLPCEAQNAPYAGAGSGKCGHRGGQINLPELQGWRDWGCWAQLVREKTGSW